PYFVANELIVLIHDLRGPGLATDVHSRHGGFGSGAVRFVDVGPHGFGNDLEIFRLDRELISNTAFFEDSWPRVRSRIDRVDAVDQPREKDFAAIGDGGHNNSHLQRGYSYLALANTNVSGRARPPVGAY